MQDYNKVIEDNESKRYYLNNEYHRLNGPAVEYKNGRKCWFKNGKLHRIGGPAIEDIDTVKWYEDGMLHRTDGPAIIKNGKKEWYYGGKLHRKADSNDPLTSNGPAIEHENGDKEWYENGLRHRIGGPAVEYKDGVCKWYVLGKLHRMDGPAIEYTIGDCEWYANGVLHRIGGPAVFDDVEESYYLFGKKYSEKKYQTALKEIQHNMVETFSDRTVYSIYGLLHRRGGPAIEYKDGTCKWYVLGNELPTKKYKITIDGTTYYGDDVVVD